MNKNDLIEKIANYVDTNLASVNSKKMALEELEKLFKYMDGLNLKSRAGKKIKVSLNFDDYNILLSKCNILNTLINIIIGDEIISQDKLEKLSENENMIGLINTYCAINNLINEDEFEEKLDNSHKSKNDIVVSDIQTDIYHEISKYPVLTKEEEVNLFKKYKDGDTSVKNEILNDNLRLVASIAKGYKGRGLPFEDLYQEGCKGLLKAMELFDYTMGYKFSTYATCWIRQAMIRSLSNYSRTIRIPVHADEKIKRIDRESNGFEMRTGRKPTIEELSRITNIPVDEIERYNKLPESVSMEITIENNSKNGSSNDTELGDFIEDITQNTEDAAISSNLKDEIKNLLEKVKLTERERTVIILRFGLYGNDMWTLEQCGKKFNVTRERIRQIEAKALRELRKSPLLKGFEKYIDAPEKALKSLSDKRYIKTGSIIDEFSQEEKMAVSAFNFESMMTLLGNVNFNNIIAQFLSNDEYRVILLKFASPDTDEDISKLMEIDINDVIALLSSASRKLKNNIDKINRMLYMKKSAVIEQKSDLIVEEAEVKLLS